MSQLKKTIKNTIRLNMRIWATGLVGAVFGGLYGLSQLSKYTCENIPEGSMCIYNPFTLIVGGAFIGFILGGVIGKINLFLNQQGIYLFGRKK